MLNPATQFVERRPTIAYLSRVIISLILSGGISYLPAQWTVSVSAQKDNRGYQLQTTSSGPQTGYGLTIGGNIYDPVPSISITGRIEMQSATHYYQGDSYWFLDQLLLASEYRRKITRVGFLSSIQLNSMIITTSHPYFGIGAGVEHFQQDVTILYVNPYIDWLGPPRDRVETSGFLVVLLGLRITLTPIEPYLEWRHYNTYHSNGAFPLDSVIPNSFNAVQFGIHLKLFSQPATE